MIISLYIMTTEIIDLIVCQWLVIRLDPFRREERTFSAHSG